MHRRLASALCLAAIVVAAGLSAFTLDYCCDVDMHCAPCASMLCWVGQGSTSPHLTGPAVHGSSAPAVLPAAFAPSPLALVRASFSAAAGTAFDGSPPGFRLALRV